MKPQRWTALFGVALLAVLAWVAGSNTESPRVGDSQDGAPVTAVPPLVRPEPRLDQQGESASSDRDSSDPFTQIAQPSTTSDRQALVPQYVDDAQIVDDLERLAQLAARGNLVAAGVLAELSIRCFTGPSTTACQRFLGLVPESRAVDWLSQAASAGHLEAQVNYLDVAIRTLDPDSPDFLHTKTVVADKSVRFLERAARAGDGNAMIKLGQLLSNGKIVPFDPANAYRYALAGALKARDGAGMDPVQVEQALPWLARLRAEVDPAQVSALRASARELASCCG